MIILTVHKGPHLDIYIYIYIRDMLKPQKEGNGGTNVSQAKENNEGIAR